MRKHVSATAVAMGCMILMGAVVDQPPDTATIERARKALREVGASAELRLMSSEPAQWANSSLGCPQRGQMYMDVITSGQVLRFASDRQRYEVHVAGDYAVVCSPAPSGVPKIPRQAHRARSLDTMIAQARSDLAGRLNLAAEQVSLKNFEPARWADFPGCGNATSQTTTSVSGYRLLLEAGGQFFTYHTDLQKVVPCPPIERM